MRKSEISSAQQEELAVMSALIDKNEGGLALADEPATYVVVLEAGGQDQESYLPNCAAPGR